MTVLLGLSGRKASGKSTLTNFLLRNASVLFGNPNFVVRLETPRHATFVREGDFGPNDPAAIGAAKAYGFADGIKEFCVSVMGLSEAQCHGTNAEKDTLTRYRWEDMPHYAAIAALVHEDNVDEFGPVWTWPDDARKPPTGPMTARAVMQEVGTGIGRRMCPDIWVEACLRTIQKDNVDLAVVDDCRFANELSAIKAAGGHVVRLHRAQHREDEHASETALDGCEEMFDAHILSRHDTPWKACNEMLHVLQNLHVLAEEIPGLDRLVGPDGLPMYGPHRAAA